MSQSQLDSNQQNQGELLQSQTHDGQYTINDNLTNQIDDSQNNKNQSLELNSEIKDMGTVISLNQKQQQEGESYSNSTKDVQLQQQEEQQNEDNNNGVQDNDNDEQKKHISVRGQSKSFYYSNFLDYNQKVESQYSNPNIAFQDLSESQQKEWIAYYLINFSPEKKPFNLDQAYNHRSAQRIYKDTNKQYMCQNFKTLVNNCCPCCNLPIEGEQIEYFSKFESISHLGPAYPLYFEFVKQSLYFLTIIFVFSGIPMLIQNILGKLCEEEEHHKDKNKRCTVSFLQTFSTSNRDDDDPSVSDFIMNGLCVIILMVFILLQFRRQLRVKEKIIDNYDVSVSDYSLMVSNIPRECSKEDIRNFFNGLNRKDSYKQLSLDIRKIYSEIKSESEILDSQQQDIAGSIVIEKVVMAYEIRDLMKWKERLEQIEVQILEDDQNKAYIEFLRSQNSMQQTLKEDIVENNLRIQQLVNEQVPITEEILEEKKELQKKIRGYEQECLKCEQNKVDMSDNFTGVAFISFKQEKMAIQVEKYFEYNLVHKYLSFLFPPKDKLFDGKKITVRFAPEPGAIKWENLGRSLVDKILRRSFTYVSTIFILGICFLFILLVSLAQEEFNKKGGSFASMILISTGSSGLIVAINGILSIAIVQFANIEIYSTTTAYHTSIAKKLGVAQFVNTALISLIVNLTVYGNRLFVNGGLVADIAMLMLLDTIVPPVMNYLDISWLIFQYMPQKYYEQYESQRFRLSQKKANKLFEDRKMNPSQRFANIIKTLLFAAFYAYLIPIGTLLALASLVFQFWMEWYLIIRKQSMPVPIGAELIHEMTDFYIESLLIAFTSGCLVFEILIYNSVYPSTLCFLVISIIYWGLPIDKFMLSLFSSLWETNKSAEQLTYQESKSQFKFVSDYDRENPVTQRYALKDYLDYELEVCKQLKIKEDQIKQQKQKQEQLDQQEKNVIDNTNNEYGSISFKMHLIKHLKSNLNQNEQIHIKQTDQFKWKKGKFNDRILDFTDRVTTFQQSAAYRLNNKFQKVVNRVKGINKLKLNKVQAGQ